MTLTVDLEAQDDAHIYCMILLCLHDKNIILVSISTFLFRGFNKINHLKLIVDLEKVRGPFERPFCYMTVCVTKTVLISVSKLAFFRFLLRLLVSLVLLFAGD